MRSATEKNVWEIGSFPIRLTHTTLRIGHGDLLNVSCCAEAVNFHKTPFIDMYPLVSLLSFLHFGFPASFTRGFCFHYEEWLPSFLPEWSLWSGGVWLGCSQIYYPYRSKPAAENSRRWGSCLLTLTHLHQWWVPDERKRLAQGCVSIGSVQEAPEQWMCVSRRCCGQQSKVIQEPWNSAVSQGRMASQKAESRSKAEVWTKKQQLKIQKCSGRYKLKKLSYALSNHWLISSSSPWFQTQFSPSPI